MKRAMALILTAVLLTALWTPGCLADEYALEYLSDSMYVVNCNEWVSLRTEPSTSAARLAKVPLGECVTGCYRYWNGFVLCSYRGMSGYILGDYLAFEPDPGFDQESEYLGNMYVVNCKNWVSLRQTPSTSAARLAKIPLGGRVADCYRASNGFIRCSYQGMTGYVLADYLMFESRPADQYGPEHLGNMYVYNCDEWVSLRAAPNTNAPRLAKVPLSACVNDCYQISPDFVLCNYDGITGYILSDYLIVESMAAEYLPGYAEDYIFDDVRIAVQYFTTGGTERLDVRCFDQTGAEIWNTTVNNDFVTELDGVDAFIAGTAEQPLFMVYSSQTGLTAMIPETGHKLWTVLSEDVDLGGSISWNIDANGIIYVGGFYGPDPVAIDPNGNVLWQSYSGSADIYWLYQIDVTDEGVLAYYDYLDGDPGCVCYDWDGTPLWRD